MKVATATMLKAMKTATKRGFDPYNSLPSFAEAYRRLWRLGCK